MSKPKQQDNSIRKWWVSVPFATAQVNTIEDNGVARIVEITPIFQVFEGQPLPNLIEWLKKKCGDAVDLEELE